MNLTQIQWEAVETAHHESAVQPDKMARLLLLDCDDLADALSELVQAGLMEQQEGDRFVLTTDGERTLRERDAFESAEVKRAIPTWQRR